MRENCTKPKKKVWIETEAKDFKQKILDSGYTKDDLLHLSMSFNENEFYEAPGPSRSSDNLADYLEYFNNPHNHKKYQYHSNLEKELLYYFQKMSEEDKKRVERDIKNKSK